MGDIIRKYANHLVTEILTKSGPNELFNSPTWDSILQGAYDILSELCPSIADELPLSSSEHQRFIQKYFGELKPEILLDLYMKNQFKSNKVVTIPKEHVKEYLTKVTNAEQYDDGKFNYTYRKVADFSKYSPNQAQILSLLSKNNILKIDNKSKISGINELILLPATFLLCSILERPKKNEPWHSPFLYLFKAFDLSSEKECSIPSRYIKYYLERFSGVMMLNNLFLDTLSYPNIYRFLPQKRFTIKAESIELALLDRMMKCIEYPYISQRIAALNDISDYFKYSPPQLFSPILSPFNTYEIIIVTSIIVSIYNNSFAILQKKVEKESLYSQISKYLNQNTSYQLDYFNCSSYEDTHTNFFITLSKYNQDLVKYIGQKYQSIWEEITLAEKLSIGPLGSLSDFIDKNITNHKLNIERIYDFYQQKYSIDESKISYNLYSYSPD